jgi:hypothetical protein
VGASVTLTAPAVAVEPGSSATLEFRIRNTGSVVDEFVLAVLGDAAGWATVEPPTVSLFPGAEETAKLVFRPPRSSAVPAGPMPFGLHAQSREDPAGSTVEEGTVQVGAFHEPFAELIPRTSRGSRGASHQVAVDNRGNVRVNAELEATDADRLLKFDVKPPAVVVEPGMADFARIQVRPTKRFWRGTPQTRPFQLYVRPEGANPITLDGTLLQEAMLPPWFFKAVALAIAGLVALVLLWLFVLKPSIETAASEAVASPLAALEDGVNDALAAGGLPTIGPPGEEPGGGEPTPTPEPTPTLEPGATPGPTPTPGGVTIPGLGTPIDGRLDATTTSFRVTGTLFITDIVFSNPNGREGALVLLRDSNQLIPVKLENIRDYDLHFVTPIVLTDGQALNLSLACTGGGACDPAVFYSGYLRP